MVVTGVILPVFFVIVLGFLLGRFGRLDVGVIARAQLYVLSPALVFMTMARTETATAVILNVFLYMVILAAVIFGAAQGLGLLLRGGRAERNAMSLASVFMNSGFYGIPVCMLAFGDMGVIYATTYVVCSSILQSTAGIFIARAGCHAPAEALRTVFKIPLIYAIIVARLLSHFSLLPPEPFMKMINLLAQAAIAVGLLLLGMQLDRVVAGLRGARGGAAAAPGGVVTASSGGSAAGAGDGALEMGAAGKVPYAGAQVPLERIDVAGGVASALIRIAGGFFLALVVLRFFHFDPVLRNVLVVESSMPTAVQVVVYATEFGCRPRLVTIGILCSTLLSVVSITLILGYLI